MLLQYLYWLRNHNSVLLHKKLLYVLFRHRHFPL